MMLEFELGSGYKGRRGGSPCGVSRAPCCTTESDTEPKAKAQVLVSRGKKVSLEVSVSQWGSAEEQL